MARGSRALWQNSGKYAVRSASGRARRFVVRERSVSWSWTELAPRYDVVVLGNGASAIFSALALARSGTDLRVAIVSDVQFGSGTPARVRVLPHRFRSDQVGRRLAERSGHVYEQLTNELVLPARRLPVIGIGSNYAAYRRLVHDAPAGSDVYDSPDALAAAFPQTRGAVVFGGLADSSVLAIEHDDLPWALASAAVRAGVDIVDLAPCRSLQLADEGWLLRTDVGDTACSSLLDTTAGADASRLAGIAHGSLWQTRMRLVTEPVAPMLDCHVVFDGVEIGQSDRGEIVVAGSAAARASQGRGIDLGEAARLAHMAAQAIPQLRSLRINAWGWRSELVATAGPPIGGSEAPGLFRASGFGDSWTLAPAVGEIAAALMTGRPSPVNLSDWPTKPSESVGISMSGGVR